MNDIPQNLWGQATALHRAGDLAGALPLYGQVIAAAPDFASAYGARAALWSAAGRMNEALADLDRLVTLLPDHAGAHASRGQALSILGRPEEALASYDRALLLAPGLAEARVSRAEILLALGRIAAAESEARAAVAQAPQSAPAHLVLGAALAGGDRPEAALAAYDDALGIDPNFALAHSNRGNVLRDLGRPREALSAYDAAIALQPSLAQAHFNRSVALHGQRRFDLALADCETALRLDPRLADFHIHHGVLLGLFHRFDDALAAYDRALALRPGHPETGCEISSIHLLRKAFEPGLKQMEQRKRTAIRYGYKDLREPEWTGEQALAGKTLFVHWEQGLGDTLQFCRYLPLLAERGARVIFSCQDSLVWLMKGLHPAIEVIGQDRAPPVFDYHAALMSLPLACGARFETIPAAVPYLAAGPDRAAAWRERLGEGGFRIGVAWRSSAHGATYGKAFEPRLFADLAALPGVRLISLQKGEGAEQLEAAGVAIESLGEAFDDGPDAFADAAAVMESLDLVITPDTAIAHLAGALGRPTWTLLSYLPDWRWFLEDETTPWYPTMRLFRQSRWDDWRQPFAAMRLRLEEQLAARA